MTERELPDDAEPVEGDLHPDDCMIRPMDIWFGTVVCSRSDHPTERSLCGRRKPRRPLAPTQPRRHSQGMALTLLTITIGACAALAVALEYTGNWLEGLDDEKSPTAQQLQRPGDELC